MRYTSLNKLIQTLSLFYLFLQYLSSYWGYHQAKGPDL